MHVFFIASQNSDRALYSWQELTLSPSDYQSTFVLSSAHRFSAGGVELFRLRHFTFSRYTSIQRFQTVQHPIAAAEGQFMTTAVFSYSTLQSGLLSSVHVSYSIIAG